MSSEAPASLFYYILAKTKTNSMEQTTYEQPVQQDENVLSDYINGYQHLKLAESEGQVKKVRNTLFIVAGLILVSDFFVMMMTAFDWATFAVSLFIAGIFVGLGFMTRKYPYAAIIVGLILFIGIWLMNVVAVDASHLYKGLLIKAYVIYSLVKGISYAKEAEKLRKELAVNN